MKINNKTELLEFIRKESLKLVKEQEALSSLGQSLDQDKIDARISTIEQGFIEVNEKKLEALEKEEDKAHDSEDFVELQRIKKEKISCLGQLMAAYEKKGQYLNQLRAITVEELNQLGVSGSGVFKNKEVEELNNLETPKGTKIKLISVGGEFTLEKVTDNNNYNVLDTDVNFISPGDLITLSPLVKIGHQAKVTAYRKIGNSWRPLGVTNINNVVKIIKNPL